MKILFLCTAHNSLSQRLFLVLSRRHSVTIEYALSHETMIEAANMAQPHIIICPFLTSLVPQQVYDAYLTLIIHPGPPGDAGPSAIDWLLMGDDGSEPDADRLLLLLLDGSVSNPIGRSHWGVTVLQATGEFDAGPVWAFDQFAVNINDTAVTKSSLYRGSVTQAAVKATVAAVERIESAASFLPLLFGAAPLSPPTTPQSDVAETTSDNGDCRSLLALIACEKYATLSVTTSEPFLGGPTCHRPLLRAAEREIDVRKHTAAEISRRIRSADSQPGCLSNLFGPKLYLYGGLIEHPALIARHNRSFTPGKVAFVRDEAVCIATCDGKGVWISHIRQVKAKTDPFLWPKVPAASGLRRLGIAVGNDDFLSNIRVLTNPHDEEWARSPHSTFQEIWVDFVVLGHRRTAYLYFDFYNGAMSTAQCRRMVQCLGYIANKASDPSQRLPLTTVVLMGGSSYFSNGIHLNVIETADDPALESWYNINAINDVVEKLLLDLPSCGVTTVAAIRGNCAAGGVALAAACDVVLAGKHVVLNPAYKALGLSGSEFHSLSYPGRCGIEGAKTALAAMMPLSADDALDMGLVDYVLPASTDMLDSAIRAHVDAMFYPGLVTASSWKLNVDTSPAGLAHARATELAQMSMDFWSARSERYHSRRRDFVRKVKPSCTPLRFASHRRHGKMMDEEEQTEFDSVEWYAEKSRRAVKQDVSEGLIRLIRNFEEGGLALQSCSGNKAAASGPLFTCYYGS